MPLHFTFVSALREKISVKCFLPNLKMEKKKVFTDNHQDQTNTDLKKETENAIGKLINHQNKIEI